MPSLSKQLALVNIGEELKLNPDKSGIAGTKGYGSLGEFISAVLPNVYIVSGVIVLILAISGGFIIITSSGNPDKTKAGGKTIASAAAGLGLIFVSYWLIKLIEFLTGMQIFKTGV